MAPKFVSKDVYHVEYSPWYTVRVIKRLCSGCGGVLKTRHQIKFCSNRCQTDFKYRDFLYKWTKGMVSGNRGINTKNISKHIKHYLISKYGERCTLCSWNKKHPITGRVPIEIDHIDGDADNNKESNLRLVCPNCHALTPSFRNLNRGRGRKWRMKQD